MTGGRSAGLVRRVVDGGDAGARFRLRFAGDWTCLALRTFPLGTVLWRVGILKSIEKRPIERDSSVFM